MPLTGRSWFSRPAETTTPGMPWEGRRGAPGEGREGGPSGCVFPASVAAAGDGVRAVRWRPQRWWSSRELSPYSAPTGRPPSTSSTPSVKVLAPSPRSRRPGTACVGRRRRRGAGLAGYGAADSLCVRGAGPGAQAARGPRKPYGFQSGGKPRGSPRVHLLAADSRWAQRGVERGPGRDHYPLGSRVVARTS